MYLVVSIFNHKNKLNYSSHHRIRRAPDPPPLHRSADVHFELLGGFGEVFRGFFVQGVVWVGVHEQEVQAVDAGRNGKHGGPVFAQDV